MDSVIDAQGNNAGSLAEMPIDYLVQKLKKNA
jgi:hypothetical protein